MVYKEAPMEKECRPEPTEKTSVPGGFAVDLATMGAKQTEKFFKAQTELLSMVVESSRTWLDRAQARAALAAEFAAGATAAKSVPDAVNAWQNFTSRQLEMVTEDSKRLLADSQKFFATGMRLVSSVG